MSAADTPLRPEELAAVRDLLARREIEDVVLRYCRGIDRLDEGLVRSCYHPDATDEHGSFSGSVDEFIEWVWRVASRNTQQMHFVGNILVEVRGDVAGSETYGVSQHRNPSGEPRHNLMTGFRYVDRFERRDGEWRIARRICTTEWIRVDTVDDHWPIPDGMRQGRRDRTDAVYSVFD